MLSMLEKLINEHGSSTILKERLELFSDKYEMLEQKNTNLEERNSFLESQLEAANKEIEKLKEELTLNQNTDEPSSLHENEIKILKHLLDTNSDFTANQLASFLNIPVGNTEYHLDKLLEAEYIYNHLSMMTDTTYSISSEGRSYVIESGI